MVTFSGFRPAMAAAHEFANGRNLRFAELAGCGRFHARDGRNHLLLVEARLVVDVVEHLGMFDAGHLADDSGQIILQGDLDPLFPQPMVFATACGIEGSAQRVAGCFGRALASANAAMQAASWPRGTRIDVPRTSTLEVGFAQRRLHDRQLPRPTTARRASGRLPGWNSGA